MLVRLDRVGCRGGEEGRGEEGGALTLKQSMMAWVSS